MSVPIITQAADNLLATCCLAGRLDVAHLAGLDREQREAWAAKIARQIVTGDLDFAPPPATAEPEIVAEKLAENVGDQDERSARRAINDYRAAKARGGPATIAGIDRESLARLAPDIAAELAKPDPWGNVRDHAGSPIGQPHRTQSVAP